MAVKRAIESTDLLHLIASEPHLTTIGSPSIFQVRDLPLQKATGATRYLKRCVLVVKDIEVHPNMEDLLRARQDGQMPTMAPFDVSYLPPHDAEYVVTPDGEGKFVCLAHYTFKEKASLKIVSSRCKGELHVLDSTLVPSKKHAA
eukprot:988639-Amphidinium_carterae.1